MAIKDWKRVVGSGHKYSWYNKKLDAGLSIYTTGSFGKYTIHYENYKTGTQNFFNTSTLNKALKKGLLIRRKN